MLRKHVPLLFLVNVVICYLKQIEGHGLCTFPCEWQGRAFHAITEEATNRVSFDDPTVFTSATKSGEFLTFECIAWAGPFIVGRIKGTNRYACQKMTFYDDFADISFSYATPIRCFDHVPSVCEVCYGFNKTPSLNVATDVKYDWQKQISLPIGCNIPAYCPAHRYGDVRCTGCERSYKEGLCCLRKPRI